MTTPEPLPGPILVLDPSCPHALAAVRGLGRLGCRVIAAGFEPRIRTLTAHSRYVERYHRIPPPNGDAASFKAGLEGVLRRTGAEVIVAAYDATIARLGTVRPSVPTMPVLGPALDAITDKKALAGICETAGVRYPRTWSADSDEIRWDRGALIVKPRRTAVASPDRVVAHTGAFIVEDRPALERAVETLHGKGLEPIVQERVDRAFKVNVSIVRSGGTSSARIAYRVLREFPPGGGRAAATETLASDDPLAERALDAAERVCDAAGYGGIANVEFYGQADGELCLLEVNTRIWGSVWLPEQLGLEMTLRAIEHSLGRPPRPAIPYPAGKRFHRTTLELGWLVSRSPDRGPRRHFLGTFAPGDVIDVASASDPKPLAATALRYALAVKGRASRAVLRR